MYNIPRPAHSYFVATLLACVVGTAAPCWAQKPPVAPALPATIPIFPLEDAVLFPGMSVPLHIFEPRYRAMMADALKGNRIIGMVELRPGYEPNYERSPSIFPVGCAGVISDVTALPNGDYDIVLQAFTKFRVTREEASKPYRIAHVTAIPERLADKDRPALQAQRVRIDTLVARAAGRIGLPKIPPGTSDEEVVNGVAQYADIDPLDRERLLEREGVLARANALIDLLEKAIAAFATPP